MSPSKMTDAEAVQAYMDALEHPMKAEIEALRNIIRGASPLISERIKWNAPSYYYHDDLLTFGPPARKTAEILLVFHHPSIVGIDSEMLQGQYKDRRLATFNSMAEIKARHLELERVLGLLIAQVQAEKQV